MYYWEIKVLITNITDVNKITEAVEIFFNTCEHI